MVVIGPSGLMPECNAMIRRRRASMYDDSSGGGPGCVPSAQRGDTSRGGSAGNISFGGVAGHMPVASVPLSDSPRRALTGSPGRGDGGSPIGSPGSGSGGSSGPGIGAGFGRGSGADILASRVRPAVTDAPDAIPSSMAVLEVLHGALVLLRFGARAECPEVPALVSLGVHLA